MCCPASSDIVLAHVTCTTQQDRSGLHSLASAAVPTSLSVTLTPAHPCLLIPNSLFLLYVPRFVAVERGAMSYPSFTIQRTRPVFASRQQVLQYEQALQLAGRVDAALEVCFCRMIESRTSQEVCGTACSSIQGTGCCRLAF
jgi:hypothetical protein